MPVCDNCGGTDFYKEAGFYYCNECQVQSQEIHEQVFQDYAEEVNVKHSKKVQSDKSDKTDNKITSWECYNYIICGLTEELINLGANKALKVVVKTLWLRYLEKLQVFKVGTDELPKLQAVNSLKDAEIIYGKLAKRKRKTSNKSSSDEVDVTTLDSSSIKRERAKKKRVLAQAQYEDLAKRSQGTPSLHNETLLSLQTSSDVSRKTVPISYSIYALKELRKRQSRHHLHRHRLDFNHELKCHRISYRHLSLEHRTGPYILSLNKLYAILYLGLLIVRDKIQLNDMLRFIKEGNLSFNCYQHLLPEDFVDKSVNFRNFKKNCAFSNSSQREISWKIAKVLKIQHFIACPDLIDLSRRYCQELNLPDAICNCVINLISRSRIKMKFKKKQFQVPNYEARVLSIILFVLKLLFGLDDATEFELSNYAKILNKSSAVRPKMFDILEWLKHIEYRHFIMDSHHFPTQFSNSHSLKSPELFLNFISKKEFPEKKFHRTKDHYNRLLTKLKSQLPQSQSIDFNPTLTPFKDYTRQILTETHGEFAPILDQDFRSDSLMHLLAPNPFIEMANGGRTPTIVNGGANDELVLEKIFCPKQISRLQAKRRRKLVTVHQTFKSNIYRNESNEGDNVNLMDSEIFKENFQLAHQSRFNKTRGKVARFWPWEDFDMEQIRDDLANETYPVHYNPYERYWMRIRIRVEEMNQKECRKFVEKFPYTFRVVLRECQRIAEQSDQEFLPEFQLTELHLAYSHTFGLKKATKSEIDDEYVRRFLRRTVDLW